VNSEQDYKNIHKVSLGFPKIEQFATGDQIRRASKSICANLAEGLGRKTTAVEQKRYISMAEGSCQEVRVWLRYCVDLELITKEQWFDWQKEYKEIAMMLNGLAKTR
jgi:four helix bundle protein